MLNSGITLILSLSLLSLSLTVVSSEYIIEPKYAAQVKILKQDPAVKIALQYAVEIEAGLTADLVELTEIQAPPFGETQRGLRFAEKLRQAGLSDVSIDEVGNVIGRRPGKQSQSSTARIVAYSAHLDTVFPEGTNVTVKFEGKKMYAPGIGDNTRGLVNVLAVLRVMQHAKITTEAEIWFIGNVGEEGLGDLSGVKHLFREGATPISSLIAIDGGDSNRIVYGGVGSHRYRVTFKGPGGHSWGAFGLANPHHALGRAIAIFDRNALTLTRAKEKTTYNIGRIGGGTSINSIPFASWMEVDMRSGNQKRLDEIDKVLQAAVQQALIEENLDRDDGAALTVDIDRVGTRPAALGDITSPLVQAALAATSAFGLRPELNISSTDANLPLSKGIPAITMSRGGRSGGAHSLDEWWENEAGHLGVQIGLITLLMQAGLAE